MTVTQVVALVGGWSAVIIGVSAFVSGLVAQRLQSKWRRDEQSQVELLKDQLSANRLALETAIHRQAAGGDLAQQRRLDAALALWAAVLVLRDELGLPALLSDILLPSEYDHVLESGGPFSASARQLTDDYIGKVLVSVDDIERARPLLGDRLWLYFYIYRAVRGRSANKLVAGIRGGHIEPWHEDGGLRQLLGYAVPDRLDAIYGDAAGFGFLTRAFGELELCILREIALVVSGETSSRESYEISSKLREATRTVNASGV